MKKDPLYFAYQVLQTVMTDKTHIKDALSIVPETENKAFIAEICYGVIRYYHHFLWVQSELLAKPLKAKDETIMTLVLAIGFYQLQFLRLPNAVIVNETVTLTKTLKKPQCAALVNACLRRFSDESERHNYSVSEKTHFSHPKWIAKAIRKAWPEKANAILKANNQIPNLVLRVNGQKIKRDAYLDLLHLEDINASINPYFPDALFLEKSIAAEKLPKFSEGFVSIQSASAQLTPDLLDLAPNLKVLDACAAPGMKTCHLLEREPSLDLTALDVSATRLEKVKENLSRLGFKAKVICQDAKEIDGWWDKKTFDRILCDVPCSATGVIRKHPEIKLFRKKADVMAVLEMQKALLNRLWPLLKVGGIFLYATCSLLDEENDLQIQAFLEKYTDAKLIPIEKEQGISTKFGLARLPMDGEGFYFAKLMKI